MSPSGQVARREIEGELETGNRSEASSLNLMTFEGRKLSGKDVYDRTRAG
jgi:hypothetical protein